MTEFEVTRVEAEATHDLRRRILRDGTPAVGVEWTGDDLDTTTHLAVLVAGRPVAISTWLSDRSPDVGDQGSIGFQLRGMATDSSPAIRGTGVGSQLLRTGIVAMRERGADHLWANARMTVIDFYTRHGFDVVSNEFVSVETAIPHRRILLQFD